MDILKDIKENLRKREDEYPRVRVVRAAQQAGQIAQKLQLRHNRNQNIIEDRLRRIKDAIKSWGTQTVQAVKPLWANIAVSA